MTIETINIGATPNDGTGDDPRTAGQKLNSNFTTNSHAASRGVGTATGNIPDADELNMVGNTNYTSGNLNPNEFRGEGVGDIVAVGVANGNIAEFSLPISMYAQPSSITITGTLGVYSATGVQLAGAPSLMLDSKSSWKIAYIVTSSIGALTSGELLTLRSNQASSKITVNF